MSCVFFNKNRFNKLLVSMTRDYRVSFTVRTSLFILKKRNIHHKIFFPTQISLLKAETGDISQAVYTSLWALFVPKSAKEANLLPGDSPLSASLTPNCLLDRFHTANRS